MRDLYFILDVPSTACDLEINNAVGEQADDHRREAARILLNPERRKVYDRAHHTLHTIGQIRSRMGLTNTRFWGPAMAQFSRGGSQAGTSSDEAQVPALFLWFTFLLSLMSTALSTLSQADARMTIGFPIEASLASYRAVLIAVTLLCLVYAMLRVRAASNAGYGEGYARWLIYACLALMAGSALMSFILPALL
jgi:hypothetical protein